MEATFENTKIVHRIETETFNSSKSNGKRGFLSRVFKYASDPALIYYLNVMTKIWWVCNYLFIISLFPMQIQNVHSIARFPDVGKITRTSSFTPDLLILVTVLVVYWMEGFYFNLMSILFCKVDHDPWSSKITPRPVVPIGVF